MKYTPVGDLSTVAICLVMIDLMIFSYVRRNKSFRVFTAVIACLLFAALSDVIFHMLAESGNTLAAYAVRCIFHALLFAIFVLFSLYITEVTNLDRKRKSVYLTASILIFLIVVIADIVSTYITESVQIGSDGTMSRTFNVFPLGYVAFVIILVSLMTSVRDMVYRKVMLGFYGSIAISFTMIFLQSRHGHSSFTVGTFLYPVIAMFYILHSNPYDVQLGAVDRNAFDDAVTNSYKSHKGFMLLSLYLRSINEEGKTASDDLKTIIRKYAVEKFRRCILFAANRGHFILFVPKDANSDYQTRIQNILQDFHREYNNFKLDYKIVITDSIDEISRKNEYLNFIKSIHNHMDENTIHVVNEDDVKRFKRTEFITLQLNDIYSKEDLDDPRVLAYCQPVYNISTGQYDTAEALMRLELEGIGIVYPDQFIPIAEENGYIHVLTRIILHKTCTEIRRLIDAGYNVTRVSVNVSAVELRNDAFCQDITDVIRDCDIPAEKIAIELTESRNDEDFENMKNKITELREHGIKFYLDDFGTGYSNMERIMELPFDIIKFDRSLVIACESSERSRKLILNLARLFSDMNYSVLYEGIEEEAEENMCTEMDASYLQGYKYSKPIPIERLRGYFAQSKEA